MGAIGFDFLVGPSYRELNLAGSALTAVPIMKGAVGSLKENFSQRRAFSLADSVGNLGRIMGAGALLHLAGERAQIWAQRIGGDDFGMLTKNLSPESFFFDPHNIPFWALNIPGFYLMGKGAVSLVPVAYKGTTERLSAYKRWYQEISAARKTDLPK